ncbi:hypothetical protein RHGRI_021004 [Rhododendron griersonianum]|uniref:BED-type domain-containing protein n=1 Tax=Rhododendron griersonianum TaxID=479676 RepID=A0AAV6JIG5_9ERIC|nr:hypothetical protein RHGRI_021004 [Rhododendron griersonianum]
MSNGQIYPTSLEGDSGAAFSSFEESSTSPVMENLDEDANNANNAILVEGNPPHEEVHEEENNPFEKKGRKKTSEVWKDFEEVSLPDGTKKYQCKSCKAKFTIHASGVTTHLNRHMRNCLLRRVTIGQEKRQKTLSFDTIGSDSGMSLTTFKYDHAKLQKRVLNFCNVPPPHTGVIIADALYKCLVDWGLENKVSSITIDNATYNDVALKNLKATFELLNKKMLFEGKIFHVCCCAHIVNIMVQDGLGEIKGITDRVREGVKYLAASEAQLIQFGEIVKNLQLPLKKLILDCSTRWNSTYMMLSTALAFKNVFPMYKARDVGFVYVPSVEDWEKVECVCEFLSVFNDVTNIISGTVYPTSNLFLIEVWRMKEVIDKNSDSEKEYMKAMALKMKIKFDKYWGECNLLMALGAVLDPRYKMKLIDCCFPEIYTESEAARNSSIVLQSLHELYKEYVAAYSLVNIEQNSKQSAKELCSSSVVSGEIKKLGGGRSKFASFVRKADIIQPVKSELEIYLEEGVYICDENSDSHFDALEWWKANNLKFRILSRMAADILSIPITSVASESTFSAGGRVIDPYRASLATETVEMLLCGADFVRAQHGLKKRSEVEDSCR